MKNLSVDDILSSNDCKIVSFEIPEWGGCVYLREMNVKQRTQFMKALADESYKFDREKTLIMAVCNEDGSMMFTEDNISAISEKNGQVVERILAEWLSMNGMSQGSRAAAEKN